MIYKPVFHRVVPTIPDMVLPIILIADVVLPEPTLPQSMFAPLHMTDAAGSMWHLARKPGLDDRPARCIIKIVFWKLPNAMHVIRQNNPRVDAKGTFLSGLAYSIPQAIDVANEVICPTILKSDREKDRGAFDFRAAVV